MRRAQDQRCPFTGEQADELHHLTGKDHSGAYLDPLLVVPLTRDQHVIEHQGWYRTGIGEHETGDLTDLRLRRAGQLLIRLGQHHGERSVTLPAGFLRALGRFLLEVASQLFTPSGEST